MIRGSMFSAVGVGACAILAVVMRSGYAQTIEELQARLERMEQRILVLEKKAGEVSEAALPAETPGAGAESTPPPSAPMQSYIVPELMLKKIHGADGGAGELRFYLRLSNNYGQDISGFEGLFSVEDKAGRHLMEFAASIQQVMASGNTVSWVGAIDIDNANQGHRRVMQLDKDDLVLKLALRKVVFSDGTMKTYGDM